MPWLLQWMRYFPSIEFETGSGDNAFGGQEKTVYGDVATATSG
jgi:hypothetical protein